VKLVGYAVASKDDEILTGVEERKEDLSCDCWIGESYPSFAPCRVVRVLIDEIEDDKKNIKY
jgi:hypothetical protein